VLAIFAAISDDLFFSFHIILLPFLHHNRGRKYLCDSGAFRIKNTSR
jgi:hypothetical protein